MAVARTASSWQRPLSRREMLRLTLAAAGAALMPIARARSDSPLRVGCILPSRITTNVADRLRSLEAASLSARRGAIYAEETLHTRAGGALELFLGAAADTRSAIRTAQRMIAHDGVQVLIGGYHEDEAEALAATADARRRLFVNVGATSDRLRERSADRLIVHVEPSASMYLDAQASWYSRTRGHRSWLAVHRDDDEGRARAAACGEAAARHGITVLHAIAVDSAEPVYDTALAHLERFAPDGVALLLDWHGQLDILGHLESRHPGTEVVILPDPVNQTRSFYGTAGLVAPATGTGIRMSSWEATVTEPSGRALSEDFAQRWGAPMDAMAWTNYTAIALVVQAFLVGGTTDPIVLHETLTAPGAAWDVRKNGLHSLDPATGQLRQDVFVVSLARGVPSFATLSSLLAIAEAIDRIEPRGDGAR
jgi:ABC-type branched-subunit amino acid transport system substrate-binding protein